MESLSGPHHIGPPRLVNFKCESSTSELNPVCYLNLELEDKTFRHNGNTRIINLELKPPTVDALLGSFEKIKQQLSTFSEKL